MKRRFLIASLASCLALGVTNPAAAKDHFPINSSDIKKVPTIYKRRVVNYIGGHDAGTIVVDTHRKFLYLVQPDGRALRYGIGVGKQGFSWSGDAIIRRKAKWPTWTPPAEMVVRDHLAAEWADGMPGGPENPLGARALYLFQGNVDTLYRIHGTAIPSSIGKAVSSGCIRLLNADVADLYERVPTGTRVVVLQDARRLDDEGRKPAGRKMAATCFQLFWADKVNAAFAINVSAKPACMRRKETIFGNHHNLKGLETRLRPTLIIGGDGKQSSKIWMCGQHMFRTVPVSRQQTEL